MRQPLHRRGLSFLAVLCLPALALTAGCASKHMAAKTAPTRASAAIRPAAASASRMLVLRASMEIVVADVKKAVARAEAIAKESGGYVASSVITEGEPANLRLRVAADKLGSALDQLAACGSVESRHVSSEDVTAEIIDLEATLKNKTALRDRLRKLLERAKNIRDILDLEQQLTRVQTEIDSLAGRLKSMKRQVQLASIRLGIRRDRILGPLGAALYGVKWVIVKLFVIRN